MTDAMPAAFIRTVGGPIEYGEFPVPEPGSGEVLVRFEASEVNHVDLFVRSGAYATALPLPFVIGRDLVGTVVACGRGVTTLAEGDRVWSNSLGHAGRQGSFSQFVVVDERRAYPLPEGIDPAAAAVVLHGAGTAHLGLYREAGLPEGQTIAVGGAAGAVGSAAVQLAVDLGARVVATAAARDKSLVRGLGAEVVLDYRDPDLLARIGEAAPGGVDVWWDTSGCLDLAATLPLVAQGGRVLITAGLTTAVPLPVGALYTRDVSLHGFAISNAGIDELAAGAKVINRLLAAGRLRGRVGATFRLEDAAEAYSALEHGRVHGRILVVP